MHGSAAEVPQWPEGGFVQRPSLRLACRRRRALDARSLTNAARTILVAFVFALVGTAGACGGTGSDKAGGGQPGKPLTLTLAAYAQPDPDEFVAAVERLSKGSIRVDTKVLWRDGQPDYEEATIADVRRGNVDLAVVSARAFDLAGVTSFQGLLAPFLVNSLALQRRILESPLAERMVAGVDAAGVVGLGVLPGPLRRPVGITTELVRVDEYRGASLGVRQSRLIDKTFRTLGASPKLAVFPRDLGVIAGMEYDVTGLDFSRYDDQASSIAANVVFWPRPVVLIANRTKFAGLEPGARNLLREAAAAALAPAFERVESNEQTALAAVCARRALEVVSASPSALAALVGAVGPVYEELRQDPFTRQVIADIESWRGGEQPEALSCPSTSVRPAASAALDGTWEWSVTRRELLDAGDTPAGAERNKGHWRLVLDSGRFGLRNLDSGDASQGTYRVEAGRLIVRITGQPAEVQKYLWSLYRDRLKLTPVKGSPAAPIAVAKPLIRSD